VEALASCLDERRDPCKRIDRSGRNLVSFVEDLPDEVAASEHSLVELLALPSAAQPLEKELAVHRTASNHGEKRAASSESVRDLGDETGR
jgi:hypothetical protein